MEIGGPSRILNLFVYLSSETSLAMWCRIVGESVMNSDGLWDSPWKLSQREGFIL